MQEWVFYCIFDYQIKQLKDMKILHIELNEYESLEALQDDVNDFQDEDKGQLVATKLEAERALRNSNTRVYWWSKEDFNGTDYFLLKEALFD